MAGWRLKRYRFDIFLSLPAWSATEVQQLHLLATLGLDKVVPNGTTLSARRQRAVRHGPTTPPAYQQTLVTSQRCQTQRGRQSARFLAPHYPHIHPSARTGAQ